MRADGKDLTCVALGAMCRITPEAAGEWLRKFVDMGLLIRRRQVGMQIYYDFTNEKEKKLES